MSCALMNAQYRAALWGPLHCGCATVQYRRGGSGVDESCHGLCFPKRRFSFQGSRGIPGAEGTEGKPGTQVPILHSVLGKGWSSGLYREGELSPVGMAGTSQPHHPHGHVGQDLDTVLDLAMMARHWVAVVGLGEAASASPSSSSLAYPAGSPRDHGQHGQEGSTGE